MSAKSARTVRRPSPSRRRRRVRPAIVPFIPFALPVVKVVSFDPRQGLRIYGGVAPVVGQVGPTGLINWFERTAE